ncbi:leucine-rich repeat and fibronectin type-III domain-containing protein 3 [Aplysia californica]|uniref:Leucine-rich repeat and fibronectin type-III domain-containing protein 3 n=1 Tax=Aplysia californica TaxID=6500 RepID=A0ABM0JC66_APLCA|nr:leucine-rich repeat and fibronectin type-III domain-containing protein 3 [Aplysia californica]
MGKMSSCAVFAVVLLLTSPSMSVIAPDYTMARSTSDSCPHLCACLTLSQSHEFVTCQVRSSAEWQKSCKELQHFTLAQEAVSLRVAGDVSVLFKHSDCLPTLNGLDLSIVPVSLRTSMFGDMKLQSFLNLSHSGIEDVPEDTFAGLTDVLHLDLSHNELTTLHPGSLNGLTFLRDLDVSYNRIQRISFSSLSHLSSLESLNMEHNLLLEVTADHLPASGSLKDLNLHFNKLSMFMLSINDSTFESIRNITSLDLSYNPLECSCVLGELFNAVPSLLQSIKREKDTVCSTPDAFKGQRLLTVNQSDLSCTSPYNFISYPSTARSVLITDTITLECNAQGYPPPAMLWITPWGEKFYNRSASTILINEGDLLDSSNLDHMYGKYEDENVFFQSSIHLLADNKLQISKFRGCISGTYRCIAVNFAGNQTHNIDLKIISAIKSVYGESLFISGCCAVGSLILGFIIGAVKMLVVWLRRKHFFSVPIFSKTPSEHPPEAAESTVTTFDQCNSKDFIDSGSEKSPPSSPTIVAWSTAVEIEDQEQGHYDELENPGSWRPHAIFESLEEARGRLRYGMGRKMEQVRKNVQSIKESGSVYVHSIKETGSSAASRMKAGVVLGVETVKSQVQSFKELCGTGNMGGQTISMMSVETDVDTNEKKEVIRQITFV